MPQRRLGNDDASGGYKFSQLFKVSCLNLSIVALHMLFLQL